MAALKVKTSGPTTITSLRAVAVVYCVTLVAGCEADPGHGGRASREWIEQLRQGDAKEREDAAVALGNVLAVNPKLERPVTALVAALADTIDAVRVAASSALAQPGVIAAAQRQTVAPAAARYTLAELVDLQLACADCFDASNRGEDESSVRAMFLRALAVKRSA